MTALGRKRSFRPPAPLRARRRLSFRSEWRKRRGTTTTYRSATCEDSQLAAATGWARGLSFEFAGSSVTVAVPAEESRTGRYQVSSVHESDVRLGFTSKEGKTSTALFKLDNDHSIRWMLGQGRAVVLRRDR